VKPKQHKFALSNIKINRKSPDMF